jgi:hypothetical protein
MSCECPEAVVKLSLSVEVDVKERVLGASKDAGKLREYRVQVSRQLYNQVSRRISLTRCQLLRFQRLKWPEVGRL